MSGTNENGSTRYDPVPGLVALGTRVKVALFDTHGDAETLEFDVVPDEGADFDAGFLGAGTPLARAVIGRPAGARVPYRLGDLVAVEIISVRGSERTADQSAAESREAAAREAADRAAREEAIQLALTFSSKWGDYDPTPLERDDEESEDQG